jgi:universal stress protein A
MRMWNASGFSPQSIGGRMNATDVQQILVPIDFSPCSRAALEYAAQLADQTKAAMDVLYVDEPAAHLSTTLLPMPVAPPVRDDEALRGDVAREVQAFLGPLRTRVRSVRVESGTAGDVIPSVARDGAFDLIVMGNHGSGGVSRVALGSVAEHVMRKAHVPVLTLRMPRKEPRERIPM